LVLLNRTVETAVAVERDLRQARAWRGSLITESGPLDCLDPVLGVVTPHVLPQTPPEIPQVAA
ncbi:MAG: hypothetical protein DRQ98_14130, partial [Gammaproteobacteria bacterium]